MFLHTHATRPVSSGSSSCSLLLPHFTRSAPGHSDQDTDPTCADSWPQPASLSAVPLTGCACAVASRPGHRQLAGCRGRCVMRREPWRDLLRASSASAVVLARLGSSWLQLQRAHHASRASPNHSQLPCSKTPVGNQHGVTSHAWHMAASRRGACMVLQRWDRATSDGTGAASERHRWDRCLDLSGQELSE